MNWKTKNFIALAGVIALLIPAQSAWALSAVLSKDNATWSDSTVWSTDVVPGGGDSAFIRQGYTVTVDSDVGSVIKMYIGDLATYGSSGTVNIVDGGKLVSSGASQIGRQKNTAYGELNLSGGLFQSGDSAGSQALWIGVDTASVDSTGIFTISGGTFVGRMILGSAVAGDSGDKLRIIGSTATIGNTSTTGQFSLEVRASGTIEWVFDKDGGSGMDFREVATFPLGSSITVDGSAYTGPAQTFTLLRAATISSVAPSITLTGFAAGATYKWDSVNDVFTVSVEDASVKSLRFIIMK